MKPMDIDRRLMRGLDLHEKGAKLTQVSENLWIHEKTHRKGIHVIKFVNGDFRCTCEDAMYRGVQCKHVKHLLIDLLENGSIIKGV